MNLKNWQIVTLIFGGLITLCIVCVAGSLTLSLFVPAVSSGTSISGNGDPTNVVSIVPVEISLQPAIVHSPAMNNTATLQPSDTPLPSLTPIPTQLALPGLTGCIPKNPRETGIVTRIIDGDTIEVSIRDVPFTVRYIGIDTPEMQGEPFALEAKEFNRNLVEGKFVALVKDVNETDRYDRLLRYVIVGDLFVNYELVKQGFAYAKDYPPDTSCSLVFRAGEAEAQTAGRALWSQVFITSQPIPPSPISRSGGFSVPCSCTGPDLDCKDFSTRAEAQACWDYCRAQGISNPHNLDGSDRDGKVCETLP